MQTESQIIDDIIRREGDEFTQHPLDQGGPTKYGITFMTLSKFRGYVASVADIRDLTVEEARLIYRKIYIVETGYCGIDAMPLRALLIDSAVQHGEGDATKFLQRALKRLLPNSHRDSATFKVDGICGTKTLRVANEFATPLDSFELLSGTTAERMIYYGKLISDTPSQAVFAHGWLVRLAEFLRSA